MALAHAAHQKERSSVSCFSHQDPSHPTSPVGPRRHTLQELSAASAPADWRNCAVVNPTPKQGTPKQRQKPLLQPQKRASGAIDSPIRYPRAENKRQLTCFKTGIPKGRPLGRIFGYFCSYTKVPRRRPTHGGNKIVLYCRIAAQTIPHRFAEPPLHKGAFSVRC